MMCVEGSARACVELFLAKSVDTGRPRDKDSIKDNIKANIKINNKEKIYFDERIARRKRVCCKGEVYEKTKKI